VIYTVREAMNHLKMDPTKSWAAMQGFGNVAQYAAIGFEEMLGGKVACVSYWDREDRTSYTVSHSDGINPRYLQSITDQYGSIDKIKARARRLCDRSGEAGSPRTSDVLIPSLPWKARSTPRL
jgi:glutamate dehydrogenase